MQQRGPRPGRDLPDNDPSDPKVSPILWVIIAVAGLITAGLGVWLVLWALSAPSLTTVLGDGSRQLPAILWLALGGFAILSGLSLSLTNARRAVRAHRPSRLDDEPDQHDRHDEHRPDLR